MRIGVDAVAVDRLARLLQRTPRFALRVFTDSERATSAERPERLAARWAAKEAVRKLVAAGGGRSPAFRDIEVVGGGGAAPSLRIGGARSGIALSLTHDAGVAIAVAVAPDSSASSGDAPSGGSALAGGWPPEPSQPLDAQQLPPGLRLPDRPDDANKGTFGRVIVVAGARGFTGAPRLAAAGAARAGAGLVTVCVPEQIHPIVAAGCLEVMPVPLPDAGTGALHPSALGELRAQLETASAAVLGPGLGRAGATAEALLALLESIPCPVVVDADGLNLAAAARFDWHRCPRPVVLTPHPAEMGRLAGISTSEVQRDRQGLARRYADERGVTVVLKGSETVIAGPERRLHVDHHKVVALATGGTGDVLAGMVAAFIAQGLDPFDAARAAVLVHAEAGLLVQARQGRAGALASDLIEMLPPAQELVRRALEASAATGRR